MREFINLLNLYDVAKLLNDKQAVKEMSELVVLRYLYQYIIDNDKTVEDLVLELDEDKSGTVDKLELAIFLRKKHTEFTNDDISKFCNFVDSNQTKELELKELAIVINSYSELLSKEREVRDDVLRYLLQRLFKIIDQNRERLRQAF